MNIRQEASRRIYPTLLFQHFAVILQPAAGGFNPSHAELHPELNSIVLPRPARLASGNKKIISEHCITLCTGFAPSSWVIFKMSLSVFL